MPILLPTALETPAPVDGLVFAQSLDGQAADTLCVTCEFLAGIESSAGRVVDLAYAGIGGAVQNVIAAGVVVYFVLLGLRMLLGFAGVDAIKQGFATALFAVAAMTFASDQALFATRVTDTNSGRRLIDLSPEVAGELFRPLLRGLRIERPNQVWCADLTYIPLGKGFLYLVAIMDWWSRKVLAWRLSNTMEVQFCVEALEAALGRHGVPEIFNTDQGSQFTSWTWTQRLRAAGVRISMDGRGRFLDNIFIERLWRSMKYECVYLHAFSGGREARRAIGDWVDFYNHRRPHAAHGGETPVRVYRDRLSASGPGSRPALQPTARVA